MIVNSPRFLRLGRTEKSDVLKKVLLLKTGEISFEQFVKYVYT